MYKNWAENYLLWLYIKSVYASIAGMIGTNWHSRRRLIDSIVLFSIWIYYLSISTYLRHWFKRKISFYQDWDWHAHWCFNWEKKLKKSRIVLILHILNIFSKHCLIMHKHIYIHILSLGYHWAERKRTHMDLI